jgi:hypothetical protein
VGDYYANGEHGFIYCNRSFTNFSDPNGVDTIPVGINASGGVSPISAIQLPAATVPMRGGRLLL